MKLSALTKPANNKPFIVTPKFSIISRQKDGMIYEFELIMANGEKKVFPVIKYDIEKAWKKLELHCTKL